MNIVITPYTTNVPTCGNHFVIVQCHTFDENPEPFEYRFSACGLYSDVERTWSRPMPLTAIKCEHCRPFAIEYLVRKFQKKSGISDLRILYDYLCDHHAGENCVSIMEEFLGIESGKEGELKA